MEIIPMTHFLDRLNWPAQHSDDHWEDDESYRVVWTEEAIVVEHSGHHLPHLADHPILSSLPHLNHVRGGPEPWQTGPKVSSQSDNSWSLFFLLDPVKPMLERTHVEVKCKE